MVDPSGDHPRARRLSRVRSVFRFSHGRDHFEILRRYVANSFRNWARSVGEEIAAEMGIEVEKVRHIQKISQEVLIYRNADRRRRGFHIVRFYSDERNPTPSQLTARADASRPYQEIMIDLTEREQQILKMRFGLDDGISHTLEKWARAFGVTARAHSSDRSKGTRKIPRSTARRRRSRIRQLVIKIGKPHKNAAFLI